MRADSSRLSRQLRLLPRTIFRGAGQIFFQRSAWTGMACIAGLSVQSESMTLGALVGALVGTVLGFFLDSGDALEDGLHGYNGALAGIGILTVLPPGPGAWATVVVASTAATLIAHHWRSRIGLPPYTAPFVVVTWVVIAAVALLDIPSIVSATPPVAARGLIFIPDGAVRGVGQVVFADHPMTGLLLIGGLALSSLAAAGFAVCAAILGLLSAWTLGFPPELAAWGLYGFNAVLTVEALRVRDGTTWWMLLLGAVISAVVTRGFQYAGVPSLTAPFLITTWMLSASFGPDRDKGRVVACSRVA